MPPWVTSGSSFAALQRPAIAPGDPSGRETPNGTEAFHRGLTEDFSGISQINHAAVMSGSN